MHWASAAYRNMYSHSLCLSPAPWYFCWRRILAFSVQCGLISAAVSMSRPWEPARKVLAEEDIFLGSSDDLGTSDPHVGCEEGDGTVSLVNTGKGSAAVDDGTQHAGFVRRLTYSLFWSFIHCVKQLASCQSSGDTLSGCHLRQNSLYALMTASVS